MPNSELIVDSPSSRGRHKWARRIREVILSVWLVVATFLGLLTFINAQLSGLLASGTPIGDSFRVAIDYFFDRPALERAAEASASGAGFSYYETTKTGTLTEDGQWRLPEGVPTLLSDLAPGQVLKAESAINLRAAPRSSSQLIGVIQPGQCVKVMEGEKSPVVDEPNIGGWVPVAPSKC